MSSNNRGGRGGGKKPPPAGQRIVDPIQAYKRLERQFETDAERLLRQHSCLSQARQVYTRSGTAVEVLLAEGPTQSVISALGAGFLGSLPGKNQWSSWISTASVVEKIEDGLAIILALSRRAERLGEEFADVPWAKLTEEQRRILRLSGKDFRSFRSATSSGTTSVGKVQPASTTVEARGSTWSPPTPSGPRGIPGGETVGNPGSRAAKEKASPSSSFGRGGQESRSFCSPPSVSNRRDPFEGLGSQQ